jgi:hypothetical protein
MNYQLGILAFIALALLVADRYIRIQPLLEEGLIKESFKVNTGTISNPQGKRCGVDLFPCAEGKRCANGMCISQEMTMPVDLYPMPVFP